MRIGKQPWNATVRRGLAFSLGMVLVCAMPLVGNALPPTSPSPSPSPSPATSTREVFFADVLVRGQPVFQIGSLEDLSAAERAQQINRRIAGLLQQPQPLDEVEVRLAEGSDLATLQLNNRVIMTVTQQDALDFDTTVEELAEQWASELNAALEQPGLAVEVAQRLEGTLEQIVSGIVQNISSIIGALLVMGLTWLVAIAVSRGVYVWAARTEGAHSTEILVSRLSYGAMWIVGTIVALGVLGLNFTALLGTLGLTSVAIGFGLKDILSNYISGVTTQV